MKIVSNHWNNQGAEVSVSEAIEGSLDRSDPYDSGGAIERLRDIVNEQSALLGKIVECLVDKDMLTKEQISNMLSWRYRVEDE